MLTCLKSASGFILCLCLAWSLPASEGQDDRPAILQLKNVEVLEGDSKLQMLTKKSFNATRRELNAKLNFWNQRLSSIDAVIDTIERLHELRLSLDPMPDKKELSDDKIVLASYLLRQCSAHPNAVERETDEIILNSYRLRCEVESEKIRTGQE